MAYYLRDTSPPGHYKDGYQFSTADKIYNVEESQRKYQDLIQQNLWLKDQIDRKRTGLPVDNHPVYFRQIQRGIPVGGDRTKNDMILWGMIERNRYLQQKLAKLKRQQQKQANSIRKIQNSEQWHNRHLCTNERCYHHKYMQLLRVRSPFF